MRERSLVDDVSPAIPVCHDPPVPLPGCFFWGSFFSFTLSTCVHIYPCTSLAKDMVDRLRELLLPPVPSFLGWYVGIYVQSMLADPLSSRPPRVEQKTISHTIHENHSIHTLHYIPSTRAYILCILCLCQVDTCYLSAFPIIGTVPRDSQGNYGFITLTLFPRLNHDPCIDLQL